MPLHLDNNPNYNTEESDIKSFKDFNPATQKEELIKLKNSFMSNDDKATNLPTTTKSIYNKITGTWDDISKEEIKDDLDAIDNLEETKNENIKTFAEFHKLKK